MSRLWLVLVTPDDDEAQRVTPDQVDAGQAWLERGPTEGYLTDANSYAEEDGRAKTGGYMIAVAPDRTALDELLATYPLRDTITMDIRPLNARLGLGFDVLRAHVAHTREMLNPS